MDLDEPRYSVPDVARKLRVHLSTAWRFLLHGVRGRKLKSHMVGGRRFVLHRDLIDFISPRSNDEPTTQPAPSPQLPVASKELDRILRGQSRKQLDEDSDEGSEAP